MRMTLLPQLSRMRAAFEGKVNDLRAEFLGRDLRRNPGDLLAGWTFTYDGDGRRIKQGYTDLTSTLTTYYPRYYPGQASSAARMKCRTTGRTSPRGRIMPSQA